MHCRGACNSRRQETTQTSIDKGWGEILRHPRDGLIRSHEEGRGTLRTGVQSSQRLLSEEIQDAEQCVGYGTVCVKKVEKEYL